MENQINPEDYLKKHIQSIEHDPIKKDHVSYVDSLSRPKEGTRTEELQFISFDITNLPCGRFYRPGTMLLVRPAQLREIQAYSTVDDNNYMDIVDKMNDMLSACVKVKYQDGTVGSYTDVKDQDRIYVIFLIRELTFQKGNNLTVKVKKCCEEGDDRIELKINNFVFTKPDSSLENFYDRRGFYHIELINGKVFDFSPPTIGISNALTEYIIKEKSKDQEPNLSFLKIIPFLLSGMNTVTQEELKDFLESFEDPKETDMDTFQLLNDVAGKMTFGIKELKKTCKCGKEVGAPMSFPNGAAGIFVIPNALEAFVKK